MTISRQDIDLTAPAGSFETLIAAIQGGADSVYFGVEKLNMRARSAYNFSMDDLNKIVRICRKYKKRAYLTLNVIAYDTELPKIRQIIQNAKKAGVNAIIASDQAIINYCRNEGIEVHISTQLNISNTETLKFFAPFAETVVLARELNLKQVADISHNIKKENIKGPSGDLIKLELFVHGALCMSVSGKCYLSLHHYNQSANRGECLQDCRRAYTVREKETGFELDIENEYIMSPKDLCTIHFLDKILKAGVRVLKIEGRARSPEYVKTVTSCYNEAINSIIEDNYTIEKINQWKDRLVRVYNRGFWEGYYLGRKLGEWSDVYGSKASNKKIYIAKALNYFQKLSVAEFLCEADTVMIGDKVIIIGPNTGVIESVIEEIHGDNGPVNRVKAGEKFSIPLPKKVRRADKLYKIIPA